MEISFADHTNLCFLVSSLCSMRHLKRGRKFGRTSNQRRAFIRILASNFFLRERIATEEAKAKELRPRVEKMVTMAKRGTLANRRILAARLSAAAAEKLVKTLAPRLAGRDGGYTRILKLPRRKSDSSRRAIIEFVK